MGRNEGPLGTTKRIISLAIYRMIECNLTLSMTLSNEVGQSIPKHTKMRSVSGYDNGRNRSYSSCPAVSHSASSKVFPLD